MLPLGEDD